MSTEARTPVIENVRLTGQEFAPVTVTPAADTTETQTETLEPAKETLVETQVAQPANNQETEQAAVQEEVKSYDPYEELGVSDYKDFMESFLPALKNGKAKEYLENYTKDYDKFNDVEILKLNIARQNPNATPKQLEILERKALKDFGVNLEDIEAAENEDAYELLALEMGKVREGLKQDQKQFVIPDLNSAKIEAEKYAEKQRKDRQDYINYLNSNADLQMFERDKKVKFSDDVVIDIEPNVSLREYLENPNKVWEHFSDGADGIDMAKFAQMVQFLQDPSKFVSKVYKMGQSSAEKAHFDEARNPQVGSAATAIPVNNGKPVIANIRFTGS